MKANTLALLLIALAMISCNNDEPKTEKCTFVDNPAASEGAISYQEVQLMADCDADGIIVAQEVRDLLNGSAWTLVGFGHGWFFDTNKPCITIDFNDTHVGVRYVDSQIDTVTSHAWSVQQNDGSCSLKLEPAMYEVELDNFSQDIMYHNGTPYDGNLYIYAKLD